MMTVLWITLALVLTILLYLVIAPFYLEVNSERGICRMRFHHIACANIYLTGESLFMKLKIIGWYKTIDLFARRETPVTSKEKKIAKREKTIAIPKVLAILRSFKLSKCHITIDTGDMALNGVLYPWFLWIGDWMQRDVQINFYNENKVVLEIENNFYRVLRAYIFS